MSNKPKPDTNHTICSKTEESTATVTIPVTGDPACTAQPVVAATLLMAMMKALTVNCTKLLVANAATAVNQSGGVSSQLTSLCR